MAPSRRSSVQTGRQTVAQSPPATPRIPRRRRSRSASPPKQPIPIRFRDEPPARSTRSAFAAPPIVATMPTAAQRIPIDCPFVGCRASTAHQHLPQLQYYRPRPDRGVHHHGYGRSSRDRSSRPGRVISHRTATREGNDSLKAPEIAGNNETVEAEQQSEEQGVVIGAEKPAAQGQEQGTAQAEPSAVETDGIRAAASTLKDHAVDESIHDENTSTLHQPPRTPPPSSPPAAEEPPSSSAQEPPNTAPEQPLSQQRSPVPPLAPLQFGDYLPSQFPSVPTPQVPTPTTPSNQLPNNPPTTTITTNTLTYDQLIRPFLAPHLPPAPGMERITAMLQEFRSLTDREYCPGGMEDMRLCGDGWECGEYRLQCEEEVELVDVEWEEGM